MTTFDRIATGVVGLVCVFSIAKCGYELRVSDEIFRAQEICYSRGGVYIASYQTKDRKHEEQGCYREPVPIAVDYWSKP